VIEAIGVVVPAHNEEAELPHSLDALHACAERLGDVPVCVYVVADDCSDQTARCARQMGARVLEVSGKCVGAARAAGMAAALRLLSSWRPHSVWLSTTDADTSVPVNWLSRQREYADAGFDAVAGTVTVSDWTCRPAHLPAVFAAHYAHGSGTHPHAHGANLGVRASSYLAVGGFKALTSAEDHDLLHALHRIGSKTVRATDIPVVTSGRRDGRAPDGFSRRLSELEAEPLSLPQGASRE
jgi:glycosyltransferase involved in cell wall biosynthesis